MPGKSKELIDYFKTQSGVVRFSDILNAGFHSDTLNSLEQSGKIEKIAHGLYKLAGYIPGEYPDLVIASLQAPRGIICLITALSFHNATTEIPKKIEIAIARGSRAYKIKYPPVKFYRFSEITWKSGIEEHWIEGKQMKIYSLSKTIADCFKFRNKIGIDVAREALKIAIQEKRAKPVDIMKYAKLCRITGIVKPIIEAML